ncbi:MAG: 30S ribosomal protein S17 [Candidatus Latescibacteria bacterium]|nr:30S ribosomal protein S17 [Candidatus Latescibacterota bacterium]MDP7236797.1 30S ribosomal protein S17 [Candidatus Latescibacterota bacterium]|tara:strand:- start:312 stop:569 length:258 start_codon:yes stop_codon:yes gene_type:complete
MAERGHRKVREGRVLSNKMDKSISVAVERLVKHPVYGRYIRRTTKLMAHDEEQTCQVGDIVRVVETRPTSKLKCWRFVDVVRRAE